MSTMTCPKCGSKIHRVTDREYVLSRGWEFIPWTPDHKRNMAPFRNPEHPHDGFELSSAVIRQNFYDYRDTLPVVRCLWDGIVRDIYIVGGGNGRSLIGNPSGYDDWGCSLIPQKGMYRSGSFNYIQYDYVQGGIV